MQKEDIIHWKKKYDDSLYNTGLEKKLRQKFQKNSFVTKDDLKNIIDWKFQRQKGRKKRFMKMFDRVDSLYVENVTNLVFETEDDKYRLKLLKTMDGIGYSLATVILSFYDPKRYGIFDRHSWRGLTKEESKVNYNYKNTNKFLEKLRKLSEKYDLPCRDIEKAYFEKHRSESR